MHAIWSQDVTGRIPSKDRPDLWTFEGCEGTIEIAVDIVIFGKSEQEHDHHLHEMLTRCRNTGLKLNLNKCKIKQRKIKFYGVICGDGVQPDPSKVSALKKMQPLLLHRNCRRSLDLLK